MEQPTTPEKQTAFDQKAFKQLRLHELLHQGDMLMSTPLSRDKETGLYAYQSNFNILISCYATISGKLTEQEKKETRQMIDGLQQIVYSPLRNKQADHNIYFNAGLWNNVSKLLLDLRLKIEALMERAGYDPSKQDPRASILGM